MRLGDALTATLTASVWFSWIAVLIAIIPSVLGFAIAKTRRRQYLFAGLLGGVAGEFCGVASLFLSLFFGCLIEPAPCNTAQGDMGLIVTIPIGSSVGCLLALGWTKLTLKIPGENPWTSVLSYSGPSPLKNWTYAIALQITFWAPVTLLSARLMA